MYISKFSFFQVEYLWGSVVKYQPSSAPHLSDIGNYATPLFFAIIFNTFLTNGEILQQNSFIQIHVRTE
jgi:hypothetical protein